MLEEKEIPRRWWLRAPPTPPYRMLWNIAWIVVLEHTEMKASPVVTSTVSA